MSPVPPGRTSGETIPGLAAGTARRRLPVSGAERLQKSQSPENFSLIHKKIE